MVRVESKWGHVIADPVIAGKLAKDPLQDPSIGIVFPPPIKYWPKPDFHVKL